MTYCVAAKLNDGLVFLSDSRTHAGLDNISTFRKMIVCIDHDNPYYRMMHNHWGQKLREVFDSIEDPVWDDAHTDIPIKMPAARHDMLKKISTPHDKLI